MLLFVSIALLTGGSVLVLLLGRSRKRINLAWLVSVLICLLTFGLVYFLRLYLPSEFHLVDWIPLSVFHNVPFLQISYQSWPYAVALVTLLSAVIITDPSRSREPQSTVPWARALGLAGLQLVAITAGDPLTLVGAWAVIDIVEFTYLLRMQSFGGKHGRLISTLGLRLVSVFALIFATVAAWQVKSDFTLAEIPTSASLFFLLAAALRLGILPIYTPFLSNEQVPYGVAVLSRLTPIISALTLIAYLPGEFLTLSRSLINILHWFALLAALYASVFWMTRENLALARPYWNIALSAFVVQSALNGHAQAGQAWGLALLLVGGELFLYEPAIRRINFLPLIGLLGLVALPYTPAGLGWEGLIGIGFTWTGLIFIFAHAFLMAGYLRYTLEASSTITGLDKHVSITFPLGLILILGSIFILGIIGRPNSLRMTPWLAPAVSLAIVSILLGVGLKLGLRPPFTSYRQKIPGFRFLKWFFNGVQSVFSLGWIYSLGLWLVKPLRETGEFLTNILEGEGGTIWYLVFIVVLFTLFVTGIQLP
jgi:hypothetical protein